MAAQFSAQAAASSEAKRQRNSEVLGGVVGAIGTIGAALLAPATGGLSLAAIPAIGAGTGTGTKS
jgi:hypothetical protein